MIYSLKRIFTKKIPKEIRCLVWDVDGTLYHSTEEIFRRMKKITIQYIHDHANIPKKHILHHIESQNSDHKTLGDIVTQDFHLPAFNLANLVESQITKADFVDKNVALVRFFTSHLSTYRHCILSNSSRKNVTSCLKKIGFSLKLFDPIITLDELKHFHKPHTHAFRRIVSETGLSTGSHMMVGDSLIHDMYPAKNYGFYTCYVNADDTHTFNKNKINVVIKNVFELAYMV